MFVYLKSRDNLDGKSIFTIGFYDPTGLWHAVEDFSQESSAREMVNYLNGGNPSVECFVTEK